MKRDFVLDFDCGDFTALSRLHNRLSTTRGSHRPDACAAMIGFKALSAPKTIVLIGLMGAGKTRIGRCLAARLDLPFVDADREIEAAAGCPIEDIFAVHGEKAFRAGERRVILRLLDNPLHVLAVGGGAFMDPAIRTKIRERGISLWLRADLDLLLRRTARRNNRPLLKSGDRRATLERLMEERYPSYAKADIVVDSVDGPPDVTANLVCRAIERYLQTADGRVKAASGGDR